MIAKLVEVLDTATFIPAIAIRVSGADGYLARRAGFFSPGFFLIRMTDGECHSDPYSWSNRTMQVAHLHVEANFENLEDNAVIDVEFLLGETKEPKPSESLAD